MSSERKISDKEKKLEMAVGIFFLTGLLILGTFTIIIKKDTFLGENNKISVDFYEVGVLQKGSKVLLRGYEIGRVEKLEYHAPDNHIYVHLNLAEKVTFYQNYKFEIRDSSILGGRYIYLDPGTSDAGELSKESALTGVMSVNVMEEAGKLVKKFQEDEKYIEKALKEDQVADKITGIVDNLKEVSDNLKNGKGTLGKLVNDDSLYAQTQKAIDDLKGVREDIKSSFASLEKAGASVESAGNSVRDTSEELHNTIKEVKNGQGTLGKFLNDDKLYQDLQQITGDLRAFSQKLNQENSSLARMVNDKGEFYTTIKESFSSMKASFDESREIMNKLQAGEGTMGQLLSDKALYNDAKETIQQVRQTVNDIREQAPISTFASFIFGAL